MSRWNRRSDRDHSPLSNRAAGQYARERAAELAEERPLLTLLSRLAFDLFPTEERSWRLGADAEELVGEILSELPDSWSVEHDVQLGPNWNADHIVLGPPGVFVLDTKFRNGAVRTGRHGVRVDGVRTDMADGVRRQAREIHNRVRQRTGESVWVRPALVFVNDFEGLRDPKGVDVVHAEELLDYLCSHRAELDRAALRYLGHVLHDPDTWLSGS